MDGENYIFIRNQETFVVLRKGADGMVVAKLNQGSLSLYLPFSHLLLSSSLYHLDWCQSKTRNVSRTNQSNCGISEE